MAEINKAIAGSKSTTERTVSETRHRSSTEQEQEINRKILDNAKGSKPKKVLKKLSFSDGTKKTAEKKINVRNSYITTKL